MTDENIVFIGGGASGATAALETRKKNRNARITVVESGPHPQYSCCALPFVLGGEIGEYGDIIVFDEDFYRRYGKMDLRLGATALEIDRVNKKVVCDGFDLDYDKLVISTGSYAFLPPIPGLEDIELGNRTFTYKFMPEAEALDNEIGKASKVVVIGAGLVGLEVADALNRRGLKVTIVELLPTVIHMMLDEDMAKIVTSQLEKKGITLMLDTLVENIGEKDDSVQVSTSRGVIDADLCVIASGVRAEARLAREAGIDVDRGILIDDHMRTSDPDIYACGDCVETVNAITGKRMLDQLGSSAVRQARVVAANLSGEEVSLPPSFGTSITHIAGLEIAAVGITSKFAEGSGLDALTARFKGSTLPEYYPGGEDIVIKLVFTKEKRILGAQIIGTEGVLARIDTISALMQCGGDLDDLHLLETAYTPPISPTIDPLCLAAGAALKKCERAERKKMI
jgi:NADH oxidase (H2O2-forming)